MKKTQQNANDKRAIWIALSVLCIAGVIICLVAMISSSRRRAAVEESYEALQALTTEAPSETEEQEEEQQEEEETETETETETDTLAELGIELPDKNINFDALQEENEDVYAWVYVPETGVDYPVLQHPTDDSYYLKHNLDGSSGYPGCIYSEAINAKDFTDNHTVFYGHNMHDDTMFASLHVFEDETVFAGNHYIYVYTPEQLLIYQIFAAYEYPAIHLLYNFDMENDENFSEYLASIPYMQGRVVHVRDDVELTADDRILTLSTCTFDNDDTLRFLVQGVLVYEGE